MVCHGWGILPQAPGVKVSMHNSKVRKIRWTLIVLLSAILIYPFFAGPVVFGYYRGWVPRAVYRVVTFPMEPIARWDHPISAMYMTYLTWWSKLAFDPAN